MSLLKKVASSVKSSARKLGLVATLASSSVLGNGCGGGSGGNNSILGGGNPTSEEYLTQAEIDLTSRLTESQLIDGTWGEGKLWYNPIDYSSTGSQKPTASVAIGLLDAHKIDLYDGKDSNTKSIPETLKRTKDYLIQELTKFPASTPLSLEFIKKYNESFGLSPSEQAIVQSAWDKNLDMHDMIDGKEDQTIRVDGIWNKFYNVKTEQGLPGMIGWKNSFILRNAITMNEPPAEIDFLKNKLKSLPIDTDIYYGITSVAHTLYALNEAGDASMNVPLLEALNSKRNLDGSYGSNSYGTDPESLIRTTAYVLMALKKVGSPDAIDTHNWLESQIRNEGHVYDPATDIEIFEFSGEVLEALLMDRKK